MSNEPNYCPNCDRIVKGKKPNPMVCPVCGTLLATK